MRSLLFVCAAAFLLVTPARAAKHPFSVDDLLAAKRIGAFSASPDGKFVVYALTTPHPDENRSTSAIWLVPLDGSAARQLTAGTKHDSDPAVVGKDRVAFLSDRDGEPQLWLLDLRGGEPRQLTHLPAGVDQFMASPDGTLYVVAARVFAECADATCNRDRLEQQHKSQSTGRVIERLLFRHWDSWADGQRSHLFRVEAQSGAARDLTPGNFDAPPFSLGDPRAFDISPDGQWLAFASNHDADESGSTNGDIWEVALGDGHHALRLLTDDNKAYDGTPRYSPDGRSLAWCSQRIPAYESDRFELRVLDRKSSKVRLLTEKFDASIHDYDWSPDSRTLWLTSESKAQTPLYRIAADGSADEPTLVVGGISAAEPHVLADGSVLFSRTSLARPTELWRLLPGSTEPVVVTHVNDALFANIKMGSLTERWVTAADGVKLHGLVVTPPDFDAREKYPALFVVHGGPEGAWGDDWSYRWNPAAFAAAGYVVYLPNPRGSTGYGEAFVRGILNDWGGKVFNDLMRQADDLESLPFVDKSKIGAAGASFGGFMMNWFEGHTKRFKALLCHDGIADQETMYATEELWFPETEFSGMPWTSEQYKKWSPIESAAHFATPELIVHGERDYRIPVEQAYLMFTTLKRRNVPTRLLVFPDENHWVLKPGNARLWYAEFFDWFHHYLGGAAADPKALRSAHSVTR